MKASDLDYTSFIALTKLATKEDPITNKTQLTQAMVQMKAVDSMSRLLSAHARVDTAKAKVQEVTTKLLAIKAKLVLK